TLEAVSSALDRLRPDLVVLLGDRYEIAAAAIAATLHRVPIAHLHGGETTAGAIDDAFRHAISKLAHLHFVAAAPYAEMLKAMGEDPERIFVTGAPGLDRLVRTPVLDRAGLEAAVDGLRIRPPFGIVT